MIEARDLTRCYLPPLVQEIADDFRDFGAAKWPVSKNEAQQHIRHIDQKEVARIEDDRNGTQSGARDPCGGERHQRNGEQMREVYPDQTMRRDVGKPQ